MKKNKVIASAMLGICLSASLLAGATYALFTSEHEVNIAVKSGKVDVLATIDQTSVQTKSLTTDWEDGTDHLYNGTATFNADSNSLDLSNIVPGDAIKFNINVKNNSTIAVKYRTRLTFKDNGLYDGLKIKIGEYENMAITNWEDLAVNSDTQTIACSIELPSDAGNEYLEKSCSISYLVEAIQGNATTENDTAYYSLSEFNALEVIPEELKTVYLNLNGVSLEGGIIIGNENIVDDYEYFTADQTDHGIYTKDMNYKKTLNVGGTNVEKSLYSTSKHGFDLILTGTLLGAKDTGGFNAGMITLSIPDACNVTFEEVTFGAGQMAFRSWYEALGYDPAFHTHKVASVVFNSCTFNGNWLQNGDGMMGTAASTNDMSFVNCTFNKYENTAGINSDGFDNKNNSNPIWIQNLGQCNVTIEGCTINAVRPIKMWEGNASGAVTIMNNTFNMGKCSIDTDTTYKNVGVMFCNGTLDNVVITGNTVKGDATALICFYKNNTYPSMNDGATFKMFGNTLNGAKESVIWKTNTEFTPDYVVGE